MVDILNMTSCELSSFKSPDIQLSIDANISFFTIFGSGLLTVKNKKISYGRAYISFVFVLFLLLILNIHNHISSLSISADADVNIYADAPRMRIFDTSLTFTSSSA